MAAIGQIIDDKYEILKLIGQGGMSRVYLAMDKRLNKQWAVKEIEKRARNRNNEVVIQSAIAEANMIKRLDHPAIVRIVDIIDDGDVIYIIEDYIEGETLASILESNGAQPQELVIKWAMQLCEALEYLHTRKPPIIYRDMKPANVMVKPDGNIKIIDFGIAREYKESGLADTVCLGTRGYAAPEQFGGKGQTDARTDVYCLGATLYHMVTGQNPGEPPYEMYPIRHWGPHAVFGTGGHHPEVHPVQPRRPVSGLRRASVGAEQLPAVGSGVPRGAAAEAAAVRGGAHRLRRVSGGGRLRPVHEGTNQHGGLQPEYSPGRESIR